MSGNNVLSLLGLALRGGRLAVGEEPAALAAKAGQARLLLAASDAAGNTLRRAEHLAVEGHCLWLTLPFTKAELGGALGRGSAALAALTDTGLAAAVAERLAQLDPERYGEAAARMDLKRRRATERKTAPRRDPPKKEPPKERDRRRPRREGDRRDGRKPEDRRDGGARRERSGPWKPGEPRRPQGGKPGEARPRTPGRPRGYGPAKGRPHSSRPYSGRPHPGKPGPRSGGDRGKGGGR